MLSSNIKSDSSKVRAEIKRFDYSELDVEITLLFECTMYVSVKEKMDVSLVDEDVSVTAFTFKF